MPSPGRRLVSPRHSVWLAKEYLQLLEKPPRHDFVVRTLAKRQAGSLMLMTGELDANVPAINTREMYYALRRLGKEVVWVNYMNGGHGTPLTTVEDFTDYHTRILDWYAKHLKREGKSGVTTNEE